MLIGLLVALLLLFWFMTMPRVALVAGGVLRVIANDGSAHTLSGAHEYIVIECVEEKSQTYPRIEGPDGVTWLVVEGPYYLRRGPLWRMGAKFINIPTGCS